MEKVMCFLPNSIIVIWYLSNDNKIEWLTHLEECSIVWRNKTHNSDFSEIINLWEWWVETLEPLNKHVYINSYHLNMHYMWPNAVINTVWDTHSSFVIWADYRFIFQSNEIDLTELNNWYVILKNDVKKIDEYKWGKWLWRWTYTTSQLWSKATLSIMNIIFISWKLW